MSAPDRTFTFSAKRITTLLEQLTHIAAGRTDKPLTISEVNDELDAIAFGINVLVSEMRWASERAGLADRRSATELRLAKDSAERANESKSVFIRNVSHEIRTPIAAMMSVADLLSRPTLSDDDRADLVDRLRTNGQTLMSLLGDVLDLSRLEAARIVLALQPVSPVDLLQEVAHTLESETRRKGLDVHIHVDDDARFAIETDRMRLRQVLVNLFANAVKFTARGSIHASVRRVLLGGQERLIIDIIDTGIGIEPDRQALVFEPFAQADETISSTFGGTGLGLALSRRLAEELGGTLALQHSAPGYGSTFRLTLVPRRAPQVAATARPNADPTIDGALQGVRVLLAEDNADLQHAVGRILRVLGASVECACDGSEAVTMAMSGPFDVVLMDVWMPVVDGLEATRRLRNLGYRRPIIAISADATTERRAASLDAHCDAYLSKPFDVDHLIGAIRLLVGQTQRAPA